MKLALATLEKRYGSKHVIAQSIIKKLKSGKTVNKPKEIRQLYDDLNTASLNLTELNMKYEVDNHTSIKEILKRCPNYVVGRCRKHVFKHLKDKDDYPTFDNFVRFFDEVCKQDNDQLYGQEYYADTML